MSRKYLYSQQLFLTTLIILGLAFKASAALNNFPSNNIKSSLNTTQASLMLEFFNRINNGEKPYKLVDKLMSEEGTRLIINQLNLARKVSPEQYKQILVGLIDNKLPDIKPLDSGERAKRGVDGLTKNVWPLLKWGLKNCSILNKRLNDLNKLDVYTQAHNMAKKYLPEKVEFAPKLFAVIGGRAGAAALKGENIYFDVLMMSFSRARRDEPYLSTSEITEFFAHEMHHIALGKILNKNREKLALNKNDKKIISFLTNFVTEGSATFFIDGHHNIEKMKNSKRFGSTMKNINNLFVLSQNILIDLLDGKIKNDNDFDKATSGMLGNNYHVTGSVMLDAIEKVRGLDVVMKILSDPRLLLIEYNKAARTLDNEKIFLFSQAVAEEVSNIGNN